MNVYCRSVFMNPCDISHLFSESCHKHLQFLAYTSDYCLALLDSNNYYTLLRGNNSNMS